jgi:hypothetical protein
VVENTKIMVDSMGKLVMVYFVKKQLGNAGANIISKEERDKM